jgi:hypothetical protein
MKQLLNSMSLSQKFQAIIWIFLISLPVFGEPICIRLAELEAVSTKPDWAFKDHRNKEPLLSKGAGLALGGGIGLAYKSLAAAYQIEITGKKNQKIVVDTFDKASQHLGIETPEFKIDGRIKLELKKPTEIATVWIWGDSRPDIKGAAYGHGDPTPKLVSVCIHSSKPETKNPSFTLFSPTYTNLKF